MTPAEVETLARHAPRFTRWLRSFGRDIAEDAVAHALMVVWERRDHVQAPGTSYLNTIAYHEAIQLARIAGQAAPLARLHGDTTHGIEGVEYDPPSPVSIDDQLQAREALRMVAGLRPVRRRVFERHLAGLTYAEIQAEQDVSYTSVNRQIVNSRAELRAA